MPLKPTPPSSVSIALRAALQAAAVLLHDADAIVVSAGAGMGVDSGLPDFRGDEGFWRAYPALRDSGVSFSRIASPWAFETEPRLAWGFYGHRIGLYRARAPHDGHRLLRSWGERKPHGVFACTTNCDGHFARAGFAAERIHELHGSLMHLQCLRGCTEDIWPIGRFDPEVDPRTLELLNDPPRCPACGGIARPNVLMFHDSSWIDGRAQYQGRRFHEWLGSARRPLVIEIGAGTAIPRLRRLAVHLARRHDARLIRINPLDAKVDGSGDVALALPALPGLTLLDTELARH